MPSSIELSASFPAWSSALMSVHNTVSMSIELSCEATPVSPPLRKKSNIMLFSTTYIHVYMYFRDIDVFSTGFDFRCGNGGGQKVLQLKAQPKPHPSNILGQREYCTHKHHQDPTYTNTPPSQVHKF